MNIDTRTLHQTYKV